MRTFKFFLNVVYSSLCLELLLLNFKNALTIERGSLFLDLAHGIRYF